MLKLKIFVFSFKDVPSFFTCDEIQPREVRFCGCVVPGGVFPSSGIIAAFSFFSPNQVFAANT